MNTFAMWYRELFQQLMTDHKYMVAPNIVTGKQIGRAHV